MASEKYSTVGCLFGGAAFLVIWFLMTLLIKFVVNYFLVKFHSDIQFSFWEVAGAMFLLGVIGGALFKRK